MPLNRPIGSDDGIYGYFLPGASGYHGRHMGSILLKNGSPSREGNTTATLKLDTVSFRTEAGRTESGWSIIGEPHKPSVWKEAILQI